MSIHLALTDDTQISHCPKLAITLDSRNSKNFTRPTLCPRRQLFMMARSYFGAEVMTSWGVLSIRDFFGSLYRTRYTGEEMENKKGLGYRE